MTLFKFVSNRSVVFPVIFVISETKEKKMNIDYDLRMCKVLFWGKLVPSITRMLPFFKSKQSFPYEIVEPEESVNRRFCEDFKGTIICLSS